MKARKTTSLIASVLFGLGLVAGLSTVPAETAAAANGPKVRAKANRAWANYKDYTDSFYLKDNDGDGKSAVLQWDVAPIGVNVHTRWNAGGYGAKKRFNESIPEGKKLRYRVCLGSYDSKKIHKSTCSKVKTIRN